MNSLSNCQCSLRPSGLPDVTTTFLTLMDAMIMNVINSNGKLCIMVVTKLSPFIPLSMTLTILQGQSVIKQFK